MAEITGKLSASGQMKASLSPGGTAGGSTVTVTPLATSGTHIADISVDGVNKEIYAPTGGGTGGISDVQVNGNSVVEDGVADIPVANKTTEGVVRVGETAFGININASGLLYTVRAGDNEISARQSEYRVIVPKNIDSAVTAVLTDGKAPALTDAQKAAAQSWLGILSSEGVAF